jgi:nucleoside-diphosphate-sugar epimerase
LQGTAKRLLYVSEATVIGDTGESFGNEDSPASPDAPHPWRATAERRLLDAVASGVHSVIVRPALVHGWGAGKLVHRLLVHAESSGESWYVGDGEARMSTVHINDVISLIGAALVRAPEGTTYVAASDEVVTWREVAEAVAATTRGPCALRSVTAAQAAEVDLDAATMAMTTVVQDHSARRRLGWTAAGPELVTDL